MRRAWIASALLLLVPPCFADQAADLLTVGKKAFGDGEYALAAKSFRRISAEFPESRNAEEANYLFGVSLFYAGSYEDSIAAFTAFREASPRSAYLLRTSYWLGAGNVRLGRYEKALSWLREPAKKSVEANPYRVHALLLEGVALEGLGHDAEAAARYKGVLGEPSSSSLFPEAAYRLGGTEFRAGRFGAARDLYSRVLIDFPQSPFVRDAVFFLAECDLSLVAIAEAEKRYRTILSLYPDSAYREAATFRLADAAWRRKDAAQSLRQIDTFLTQYPGSTFEGSALRLRADIAYDQRRYDDAVGGYRRAVAALADGSERQSAYYSMGLAQLALGLQSEAAESFAEAGGAGTGAVAEKAGFQRAVLLAGAGKDGEAIAALDAGIRAFPNGPDSEESLKLLATLLEKTGDRKEALARWDALVAGFPRSPSLPEALYRRASTLLSMGRSAAALDELQKVVKDFPGTEWARESSYSIGYVYTQRGEYPRALPFFQVVAQDPRAGEAAERSRLSIAICFFNMGSFDKALSGLQDLLQRNPASVPQGIIRLYIGRSLYRMERLDEAAARLGEAARLLGPTGAAEGADADYWRGWASLRLGRLLDARDAFFAVARDHPTDPRAGEALFRAGVCETMRGDDKAAVKLFDEVVVGRQREGDTREQALYERGWALARLGRPDDGLASLEQLAREYPGGRMAPQAFFKVAETALDRKQFTAAQAGFQRVAREFPRSELALQALYWAAEATRRGGDAAAALDGYWAAMAAGATGGLLDSALEGFAAALRAMGSRDLARQFAERARTTPALDPEGAAGIQLYYAEFLLVSSPSDALALITQVRRGAPPEPIAGSASLLLGKYYAVTGDSKRALEIFGALEGSRGDEVGARAVLEHGLALEAIGRTSDAIDELLKVSYLFPGFDDIAAEGLYNGFRIATARGDTDRAAKIAQSLRAGYPGSAWIDKLAGP